MQVPMPMNLSRERDRLDWLENQQRPGGRSSWLIVGIIVIVCLTAAWVSSAEPPARLIPGQIAPAWLIYRPAGFRDGGGILADVISRCTPQQRQIAYESDRVTFCHEATHQLHSRIRQQFGGTGSVNAVYCGGGRCLVFREPRIRLSHVRQYVTRYRNSTYQLYLVSQASSWENEPLYVLDEWVSYANGTQAARELRIDAHGSDTFMLYFSHYADALIQAVEVHDPHYAQLDELRAFVAWHKQRCEELSR